MGGRPLPASGGESVEGGDGVTIADSLDQIPQMLRQRKQWVVWREELRDDNSTKIPYNAITSNHASTTMPDTWSSYEQACEALNNGKHYDGLGYVFSEDDGIVGVDLDDCIDPEGKLNPRATQILEMIGSYTEYSPSGRGLHILVRAELPGNGINHNGIEMYDRGRYFCTTGEHFEGTPTAITDQSGEVEALYKQLRQEKDAAKQPAPRPAGDSITAPQGYGQAALTDECNKVASAVKGERNSTLNSAAFNLGQLVGSRILQQNQVENELLLAAQAAGLSTTEAEGTIRSGLAAGITQPREPAEAGQTREPGAPVFRLTERGAGERFAHLHKGRARFCVERDAWLWYDGSRWTYESTKDIEAAARQTVRHIDQEAMNCDDDDRRKTIRKHATTIERRQGTAAMLWFAGRQENAVTYAREFDADVWTLNCQNGSLDLRKGELRPHDPADLLTRQCPLAYDPNAAAPLWDKFLRRIMNDNQVLIDYLQCVAGMALTGDASEHLFFLLYGTGANGKSVFCDTIVNMLGDYACEGAPDLFTVQRFGEHPTELADLCGKRLVVTSETEENRRLKVALVKRLTGNSTLKARFMRQDYFEFPRTQTFMLATNNRPDIRENTLAVWRRLRLVPFSVTIPETEQDPALLDKLRAEWPGILRWCLEGCLRWQRDGRLRTPEEVSEATGEYRAEQDVLREYLEEGCFMSAQAVVPRTELFASYRTWAEKMNERFPLTRHGFYDRVRKIDGVWESKQRFDGKASTDLFCGIGLLLQDL